jgi:hypothetical protein
MNNTPIPIPGGKSPWWDFPLAALLGALFVEILFLVQVFIIAPSGLLALILPGVVVDETNTRRVEEALPALALNPILQIAAQRKAEDMASKGYFAHVAPDGVEPWAWFKEAGYVYTHAGENLAVNFMDSKDVVDAWMRSPSHRANIENARYTEIGIGVAEGSYQGRPAVFVVQFFGNPAPHVLPRPVAPIPIANAETVLAAPSAPTSTATSTPTSTRAVASAETAATPHSPAPYSAIREEPTVTTPIDPSTFTEAIGEIATIAPVSVSHSRMSSVIGRLLASPRATANYFLLILATALAAALVFGLGTAYHTHFPRVLAGASLGLLVIVTLLAVNHAVVLAAVQVR